MKKLYILKIGGSVLTNKNSKKLYLHTKRIHKIAQHIKTILDKNNNLQLIIIHGGGGAAHHLAHKYSLRNGVNNDKNKLYGATLIRLAIQKLNTHIFNIFLENKLPVLPVHTSAIATQANKKITTFNTHTISKILKSNYIPIIYGDMVFDDTYGMSVLSGDTITAHLAQHFNAKKVFLATDVSGIFTKDPYKYSNTKLIAKTTLSDVFCKKLIKLTPSHNIDVTGGLKGKLQSFKKLSTSKNSLKQIVIFDGTNPQNYTELLSNNQITATYIKVK